MAEVFFNDHLEIQIFALHVSKDVLVNPFVDELGVDLKRPDKTSEHLDAPWVPEHVLHVGHIHTELVAEALLHIEGDLTQDAMNLRDSFVGDSDLRQVRVLEETIIWLVLFDAQSHGPVIVGLVASCLGKRDLSASEHLNVAAVLVLDSPLDIL